MNSEKPNNREGEEIIEGEFEVIKNDPQEALESVEQSERRVEAQDATLVQRYFEGGEKGPLDPRIVDYFRNYVGPEETIERFNSINPISQKKLIEAIESGNLFDVVFYMESHMSVSPVRRFSSMDYAFSSGKQEKLKSRDRAVTDLIHQRIDAIIKRLNGV
jgi:hypothetical protein